MNPSGPITMQYEEYKDLALQLRMALGLSPNSRWQDHIGATTTTCSAPKLHLCDRVPEQVAATNAAGGDLL